MVVGVDWSQIRALSPHQNCAILRERCERAIHLEVSTGPIVCWLMLAMLVVQHLVEPISESFLFQCRSKLTLPTRLMAPIGTVSIFLNRLWYQSLESHLRFPKQPVVRLPGVCVPTLCFLYRVPIDLVPIWTHSSLLPQP